MKTAEWERAARLGNRKLKKVGRMSTLIIRKNSTRNPELESMLGRGKAQSSDQPHQAQGTQQFGAWGWGVRVRGEV